METKRRVTKVEDTTKGEWLQDAFTHMGLSTPDAAREMSTVSVRRLNQHISNESHLGTSFYGKLKSTFPSINLNYIISGELPVLLKPTPDADKLRETLSTIRDKASEGLGG